MIKSNFLFLYLIILISCQPKPYKDIDNTYKVDSLLSKLEEIQDEIQRLDSNINAQTQDLPPSDTLTNEKTKEKKVEKRTEIKKQTTEKTKETQKPKSPKEADSVFHYFKDGRLSVKIHPWKKEKQLIEIFNPFGKVIYTLENIHLSYTTFNDLKFRDNGSLESVKSHHNPGASMYMYESITLFDIDNEPTSMQNFTIPARTMEDAMGETYLWDRKNKKWIKQEIVKEYNSPER